MLVHICLVYSDTVCPYSKHFQKQIQITATNRNKITNPNNHVHNCTAIITILWLANLLTGESRRIVVTGDLMFFRSQTFTIRSSLPDTRLSPQAKTAVVTGLTDNRKDENNSTTTFSFNGVRPLVVSYCAFSYCSPIVWNDAFLVTQKSPSSNTI